MDHKLKKEQAVEILKKLKTKRKSTIEDLSFIDQNGNENAITQAIDLAIETLTEQILYEELRDGLKRAEKIPFIPCGEWLKKLEKETKEKLDLKKKLKKNLKCK